MQHARKRNVEARARRQARREVADHAGGRIRARRNPSRARGKTRRAFGETGDRERIVESAACRRRPSRPACKPQQVQEGKRRMNASPGQQSQAPFSQTGPCIDPPDQARIAQRRVAKGAFAPGENRGTPPLTECPERRLPQGGTHQKTDAASTRSRALTTSSRLLR